MFSTSAVLCVAGAAMLAAGRTAPRSAADPGCAADWDSTRTMVERDYAGYRDKTGAAERRAAFAALTDSVRAAVEAAADDRACTAALQRWTTFFRDPHLSLWQPDPDPAQPAAATTGPTAAPPAPYAIRYPDDSTAVLVLSDFGQRRKAGIDSLLAAHRARLLATPYLVIDVRRNGGGWTESYAGVLPLLYTDPIRVDGMEAWASEGNVAYVRGMLASERAPAALKEQLRPLLARMEAHPGEFVVIAVDSTIRMPEVLPLPRAVALLTARQCASTCEQFVLDARQSRKVVVIGAGNTRGMTDYGNARTVTLPSGLRRLQLPSARSMRLPETRMDMVGIAPDVRIPEAEADTVAFAVRELRRRAGAH
jgi:hypothetical protein